MDFGKDLLEGDEAVERTRLRRGFAVRQFVDPVEHADRERFSALGTQSLAFPALRGVKLNPALAMTVKVILALLGKEFDRPQKTGFPGHRFQDGIIAEDGVEEVRLPSQLGG